MTDLFAARVDAARNANLAKKTYEATVRGSVEADAARAALDAACALAEATASAHEATLGSEEECRAAAIQVRKLARV